MHKRKTAESEVTKKPPASGTTGSFFQVWIRLVIGYPGNIAKLEIVRLKADGFLAN